MALISKSTIFIFSFVIENNQYCLGFVEHTFITCSLGCVEKLATKDKFLYKIDF